MTFTICIFARTAHFLVIGLAVLIGSGLCTGCAATMTAIEHRNLKVQTKMSETIFLDAEQSPGRTVFVDVKNTSGKSIDVASIIRQELQSNGYTVVSAPAAAAYILQANVLFVDQADQAALREWAAAGFGGPLAGIAAGAAIGGAANGWSGAGYGAAAGGIIGTVGEMVGGVLIKNVTYTMVTDLQISERTTEAVQQEIHSRHTQGSGTQVQQRSASVRDRRKYQTRIISTANKTNLKFEDAKPQLTAELGRSIAGIF